MRTFFTRLIVVIGLFTSTCVCAQDELLLLTGKTIQGKVTAIDSVEITYEQTNKRGKTKTRTIDKYRVFSITYPEGREEVLYMHDTTDENDFTEEEMRLFIYGEQDGMKNFRTPWSNLLSFVISGGASYGIANSEVGILVVAVPFAVGASNGIGSVKVDPANVRDPKYLKEAAYLLGYERTSRSKRVRNGSLAAVAGWVSALVAFGITDD